VDVKTYLADDILVKVDRMSMAASLEARVPLLDYRIVEFALNLPPHLKLNGQETKVILRRIMANRLPEAVLNKPKEGFSIPLETLAARRATAVTPRPPGPRHHPPAGLFSTRDSRPMAGRT
jgi:asparagine synthetase B (glutamine-hydrolysing)